MKHYERTGEVPGILQEEPQLNSYLYEFFRHFTILSRSRTYGMSANPIQYVEIEAYCRIMGIKKKDVSEFTLLIMEMDSEFMEHAQKSTEPGKKTIGQKNAHTAK